jgi:hypothetical protein
MKNKLMIFILIGANVLLAGAVGAGHYFINMEWIPQTQEKINNLNRSCADLEATISQGKTVLVEIEKAKKDKVQMLSRIPVLRKTFDDFLDQIQILAMESQVVLDPKPDFILQKQVAPGQKPEQLPKSIIKVQLQITAYGKFFNLTNFLYKLEHMDLTDRPGWLKRYIKIYYYVLERQREQKEGDQLKLNTKVNTYLFDEATATPMSGPSTTAVPKTGNKTTGVPE